MYFCPNCKHIAQSDEERFCPNCGTALSQEEPAPVAEEAVQEEVTPVAETPAPAEEEVVPVVAAEPQPTPAPAYQTQYQAPPVQPQPYYQPAPPPAPAPTQIQIPKQYKPLGAWAYFGYTMLFSVPLVGFIFLIIYSFNSSNINRRNFARSYWCGLLIAGIAVAVYFLLYLILFAILGAGASAAYSNGMIS